VLRINIAHAILIFISQVKNIRASINHQRLCLSLADIFQLFLYLRLNAIAQTKAGKRQWLKCKTITWVSHSTTRKSVLQCQKGYQKH